MSLVQISQRFLNSDIGRKLVGPGLIALVIKVVGAALSYLMFVAFAHFLSPEDYGYFGLSFNLSILLATICSFGFATGIMRFWPEYLVLGQMNLANGIVKNSLEIISAGTLAVMLISLVFVWMGFGSRYLGFTDAPFAIAVLAAASAFSDFAAGLLRSQGKVVWAMLPRDVAWRLLTPAFAFIVTVYLAHLDGRSAIYLSAAVLVALVTLQVRKIGVETFHRTQTNIAQSDWPKWRKTLTPLWASSVLYAMIQQLDVVIVGAFTQPAEAGAYFAAQKTASMLGLVMIAGGLVGAPLMSANYHSGKFKELQKLSSFLSVAIAVTTMIGLFILVLFGHELLGIFDHSFKSSYPVLIILALGYAVDSLAGPNAYLMQMTALESSYFKIMACCYAGVLAAQIVLAPIYGGLGVAIASACGIVTWNICAIILLRKRKGLDPSVFGLFIKPKYS
jgi:O-antigen/teichoic acid export membrane protein